VPRPPALRDPQGPSRTATAPWPRRAARPGLPPARADAAPARTTPALIADVRRGRSRAARRGYREVDRATRRHSTKKRISYLEALRATRPRAALYRLRARPSRRHDFSSALADLDTTLRRTGRTPTSSYCAPTPVQAPSSSTKPRSKKAKALDSTGRWPTPYRPERRWPHRTRLEAAQRISRAPSNSPPKTPRARPPGVALTMRQDYPSAQELARPCSSTPRTPSPPAAGNARYFLKDYAKRSELPRWRRKRPADPNALNGLALGQSR